MGATNGLRSIPMEICTFMMCVTHYDLQICIFPMLPWPAEYVCNIWSKSERIMELLHNDYLFSGKYNLFEPYKILTVIRQIA